MIRKTVDVNPEMYKKLQDLAYKENRSVRNMIETLIIRELRKQVKIK